ncbi:MAG: radical SAM protein [Phenylobacterium sp.]|uniref:B12-binding domain-containing radical SAM protein n=1 Tax=Phenylobacterium sp. TaxID=1871053 RepID=UPI001A570288|nr:radical SAM protein [Phenylobacterium sp.]MBL8555034.1 radical SAM protein [Phenylobacterium sp.]
MKPARSFEGSTPAAAADPRQKRILIVDLNNFSTFPTLAIGILVAALRNAGHAVRVLSPLAHDVPAAEREHAETYLDHIRRRIHLSTWAPFRETRDAIRGLRRWWLDRPHPRVLAETERELRGRPDVVLLSAYMQHFASVTEIGRLAERHGVPMLLGGPMFNLDSAAEAWRAIPGLTAIIGAEADLSAPRIVATACAGGDLTAFSGVMLPDGRRSGPAPPLRRLDAAPIPDFSDFPWDRYRVRIVPIMASRGCQWAKCSFCSDVISVSGRSFRSRSADNVLHEIREQARRQGTNKFLFLDLKLNSNPHLLRSIVEGMQRSVPGAEWIGTVHVDDRADNGLSRRELRDAVASGMRRISFGLESGSQAMLDAMKKGSSVEGNAEFIRTAHEAGLSIRCTMFKGYPGETAEDLDLSAEFLERHADHLDRVRCNEFSIPAETPIHEAVTADPSAFPNLRLTGLDARRAQVRYVSLDGRSPGYRRAKARLLRAVYDINRRKIRSSARAFDGLM